MTDVKDLLQDAYLGRLWVAAAGLSPDARDELLAGVAQHLAEARAVGHDDETAVRNVLERLGDPADLVAAAREHRHGGGTTAGVSQARSSPWGGREVAGVVLLGGGNLVLPFAGALVGSMLVSGSACWTAAERALATVAAGLPIALIMAFVLLPGVGAVSHEVAYALFATALVLLPASACIVLVARLNARPRRRV